MSMTPWKGPKQSSGWCACSRTATLRKGHDWVCDRCRRLESEQYHKSKAHTAGMRQMRMDDAMKAEVPV
jgi:hypothetical protein